MEKLNELRRNLDKINLMKSYRVQELLFGPDFISIRFYDNPGTMKKLQAFVEWFFPMLEEAEATKAHICTECKGEIEAGSWKLINGMAFYLHDSCAESVKRMIAQQEDVQKEERKGKVVILILAVIFGVLLGTFGGEAVSLAMAINSGELSDFVYADIPYILLFLLFDSEYLLSIGGSIVMGLLFAGLGVYSVLKRANREVSGTKVIDLP